VASWSSFFIRQNILRRILPAEAADRVPEYLWGDKQWKAVHRDLASISKTRVFLPAYKQQFCYAARRYHETYRRGQKSLLTYKEFVRNIPLTESLSVIFFPKYQTCAPIRTAHRLPFLARV